MILFPIINFLLLRDTMGPKEPLGGHERKQVPLSRQGTNNRILKAISYIASVRNTHTDTHRALFLSFFLTLMYPTSRRQRNLPFFPSLNSHVRKRIRQWTFQGHSPTGVEHTWLIVSQHSRQSASPSTARQKTTHKWPINTSGGHQRERLPVCLCARH